MHDYAFHCDESQPNFVLSSGIVDVKILLSPIHPTHRVVTIEIRQFHLLNCQTKVVILLVYMGDWRRIYVLLKVRIGDYC